MGTGLRAMLRALGLETRNQRLTRLCGERTWTEVRRHDGEHVDPSSLFDDGIYVALVTQKPIPIARLNARVRAGDNWHD